MLNRFSINLVLGLILTHEANASRKQLTLTTEELGGDSTEISNHEPLVVHLDKNSMSSEALEDLARTSNIDIANLPDFPQFVRLGEFERMKYSTDDILEELVREQELDLNTVKQNERFHEIEEILKEIADEYAEQDEREQCRRGQYKDRSTKGDEICDGSTKGCCENDDDEYWNDDNMEFNDHDDVEYDDKKSVKDVDDKEAQGHKDEPKEDKLDEKLEDKIDEKLDKKLKEKLDDTKNNEEDIESGRDEKDDKKNFFWQDEEEKVDEQEPGNYVDEDEDDYLTIKEPQYEETFRGTEISIGDSSAPTQSTAYSNVTSTWVSTSSMVYNTTSSYTTKYESSKQSITSSSYQATSVYSSSKVTIGAHKISTISAESSSKSSSKSASEKYKSTTATSKHQRRNSATLSPNWKAQSNVSNVTVQGIENSSSFLMPTTFLFASLLAALAILQT